MTIEAAQRTRGVCSRPLAQKLRSLMVDWVPAGALLLLLAGISACRGGGSASGGDDAPNDGSNTPPSTPQSPGGVWASPFGADSVTMYISETGELIVTEMPLAFGSGAVLVTDTDRVTGAYTLHTPQTSPSAPRVADQTCEVDGVVRERFSLMLSAMCEDADGNVVERDVNLLYIPDYESPSSLDDIAGNYTLAFDQATNSLSISNNGVIFGMFHNGGTNCVVNGEVEIIDPAFALYRFTFNFANCTGAFGGFEGATMTGLGIRDFGGATPGSFLLMIAGVIADEFRFFSVLYEPA
jgi:hypothetical protein